MLVCREGSWEEKAGRPCRGAARTGDIRRSSGRGEATGRSGQVVGRLVAGVPGTGGGGGSLSEESTGWSRVSGAPGSGAPGSAAPA